MAPLPGKCPEGQVWDSVEQMCRSFKEPAPPSPDAEPTYIPAEDKEEAKTTAEDERAANAEDEHAAAEEAAPPVDLTPDDVTNGVTVRGGSGPFQEAPRSPAANAITENRMTTGQEAFTDPSSPFYQPDYGKPGLEFPTPLPKKGLSNLQIAGIVGGAALVLYLLGRD
jgi:hypothetical protein